VPIILALKRLRQKDQELKASLGYIVRLCLTRKKTSPIGNILKSTN
jgi:hypothetical protein